MKGSEEFTPEEGSEDKKIKNKKKKKKREGGRTKETMFRTMMSNLVHLSTIADNKANMMISVNAIIVSIMVSFLLNQYQDNPSMIWPTFALVIVCLITIMYAIMAAKPSDNIFKSKTKEEIDLLFFGDYSSLSMDDYKGQMAELLIDDEKLSDKMLTNMYSQGHVLTRKFSLLRISFTVFMVGFPLVILLYLVVLAGLL